MQWSDEAIIISTKKYGESSLIVNLLTPSYGLHAGLVRGAKKSLAICQAGNLVDVTWKGRLEEHLGNFTIELKKSFSSLLMDDALKLGALNSSCSLVKKLLPEKEPHSEIFDLMLNLLANMSDEKDMSSWTKYYVELELGMLRHLGYGLDLSSCAATGDKNNLSYVSPKSGRAVSEEGGEPYKEKLLKLPSFLRPSFDKTYRDKIEDLREIIDGVTLTKYFLEKYVFAPQNVRIPAAREVFDRKLQESCI